MTDAPTLMQMEVGGSLSSWRLEAGGLGGWEKRQAHLSGAEAENFLYSSLQRLSYLGLEEEESKIWRLKAA